MAEHPKERPDDICPRPEDMPPQTTRPIAPAIYPATVWQCESPAQAERLLTGEEVGYVYQRDGHPNGDQLAEKLRQLHGAERAIATSSGMAALSAAVLAHIAAGGKIAASSRLYGKSLVLLSKECSRLGIECKIFDPCDLDAFERACNESTSLAVVETISNPTLRVADIPRLAEIAHRRKALLLVDNTFATPIHCRPLEQGADLVMESVSKMINGHSDVMIGFLCGAADRWDRVPEAVSAWGLNSAPFDCYLASRGLATLHLRMERASSTALAVAEWLLSEPGVRHVDYPGLPQHPDHAIAQTVLNGGWGSMVAFHLDGGRSSAEQFLSTVSSILPFAPSLGEVCTTLSHPASTSHRAVPKENRASLGFDEGTLRLSVGVESFEHVRDALKVGLAGCR